MKKLKIFLLGGLAAIVLAAPTAQALTPNPDYERYPFIRLYNSRINDHFYTNSRAEASLAQEQHGYKIEGEMGYLDRSQKTGTVPVIRMWNPRALKHFYTTDSNEAARAQSAGFVNEGVMGYILVDTPPQSATGDMASPPIMIVTERDVYRMYNSAVQKHFYTTARSEMQALLTRGYRLEGDLGTLYGHPNDNIICPDYYVQNDMPSTVESPNTDYYILDGRRIELDEYDEDWIKAYCDVPIMVVN